MSRWKHHSSVSKMVVNALPQGMTRKSQTVFEWDVSGRCENPRLVELTGRPQADWRRLLRYIVVAPGTSTSLHVELLTPCRRCQPCLKARARMWAARAMHEIRTARRTWFCTYTLRPEAHYIMQCRAVAHADARSIPVAELTGDDLFNRQSDEVGKEITLMIKRLRKELKLPQSLRYLIVREKHKTGLPHWHAFIHEQTADALIKHAMLAAQWQWGFAKYKLVDEGDPRAAFYVSKYLGKSNEGRVRASLRYGRFDGAQNEVLPEQTGRTPTYVPAAAVAASVKSELGSGADQNEK